MKRDPFTIALVQMSMSPDPAENLAGALRLLG
jgi:hypothetical protein